MLTARGEPVSGAFVTIKDATVRVPEIAIMTNSNGRFEIRLPAGLFTLRTFVGGRVTDTRIINPEDSPIDIIVRNGD